MENRERFLQICGCIERDGIKDLLNWLDKTDFYTAPASTRFHGSYVGGLLQHSLNVYDEFNRLLKAYPEISVSDESVAIMALLHDLCKVNFYGVEQRNRKNEAGVWEKYDAFTIDEQFPFGGHGSKSVAIIQNFMKLSWVEAAAINCHMGGWSDDQQGAGKVFDKYPVAWLLSVADQSATYVKERVDG